MPPVTRPSPRSVVVIPANNNIALTVVRSLGRAGFHVIAFASKSGVAPLSRYCHETFGLTAEPLADQLLRFVSERPGTYVIGLGEVEIQALNQRRTELARHATLLFPTPEQFGMALDKGRTLEIARSVDVPVPRSVGLADDAGLERCRELAFPVVMKPLHQDVLDFKSKRLDRYEDLVEAVGRYRAHRELLLVQEYCAGYGVGVELLMHRGEVALAFQHRRIRESPPGGGVSVCCESVRLDPVLLDHSVRLLRAMGWEGVAMVEYRYDPARASAQLMEVNGRFWGSIPLATRAGADFPAVLVELAASSKAPARARYREGLRCRNILGDTRWLLDSIRGGYRSPLAALGAYIADFRPGVAYYVWRWDDPWPAIATFGRQTAGAVTGLLRRIIQ